jgi:acyl-CoA thioester hydrolase
MSQLPKILSSKKKIRFSDSSPYGHLAHGKYLDYFLDTREDQQIEFYHLNFYQIAQETGRNWLVSSTQVSFLKPAIVTDFVIIESQIISFSEVGYAVEMRMIGEKNKDLKAFMWVNYTHVDLNVSKIVPHHPIIQELFTHVASPIAEKTFEERQKTLRR